MYETSNRRHGIAEPRIFPKRFIHLFVDLVFDRLSNVELQANVRNVLLGVQLIFRHDEIIF